MSSLVLRSEENHDHIIYHLNNGLRVVYTRIKHSKNVFCGFAVGAGSRCEDEANNGIAHLIEHLSFKKTKKRSAYQILNRLESVGGDINAYTTRERTCFYTSSERRYFERAFELLTDIVFNTEITEENLAKERQVIFEEIEMYDDSPEESIYDDFHKFAFQEQSIGRAILGSKKSLEGISVDDVKEFKRKFYSNDKIVISIAGNIPPARILSVIHKYLEGFQSEPVAYSCNGHIEYSKFEETLKKDFQQVHCILGNLAYSIKDPKKYALSVLNNILGGDWMSSRLNMSIREKHAYVYNIYTSFNVYNNAGLYIIQFGTDEKYLGKCIGLIDKELIRLRNNLLTNNQLNKSKRQLLGQYSLFHENGAMVMQSRAKNLLDYKRIISREEYYNQINAVTAHDVLEVANEVFHVDKLSKLVYRK